MVNNIIIVMGFILVIIAICKIWNLYTMKQYLNSKKNKLGLKYSFYAGSTKKLKIVGVGSDGNGDYDAAQAIKKIELPDDIRIRVNE